MARARNIKPGFFKNEELVELSFAVRLLFVGLWTIADRAGRLEDKPKKVKMELFPADNLDINAMLDELDTAGFIKRYAVGEARYIQILAFSKHQNPHKDEKVSTIPAPCEPGASTVQPPKADGGNPADSLLLNPDPLNLNPDCPASGEPAAPPPLEKQTKPKSKKTQIPDDFGISDRVRAWAVAEGFTRLVEHLEAFKRKVAANGYTYVKWDDAFMEAIRTDWAKLRGRTADGSASPANHESADDIDTRIGVEKQAFERGIGPWNPIEEQFPAYRERVLRSPRLPPAMTLDQLISKAPKGATA
jgi:hypothetical protein